ncbi:cupin domain-containing protein [Candidatus Poribacteria bacterium]|nr:cupin domain-containing protein [Candidatus Poribacteria bacterium]
MVIKHKNVTPRKDGTISFPIKDRQNILKHFAYKLVTPEKPFRPHSHDGDEIWYIISGKAVVDVGGEITEVEANDLIICPSNVSHGMTSDGEVYWLCIG